MDYITNWYMANLRALQKIYGGVAHSRKFSWILIHDYQLPPYFNVATSALLITTPGDNLMASDGFSFFLNKKLRRTDGKPTNRLHDNDGWNPHKGKGYSRLSFHINDFRPKHQASEGDNLVDLCVSLYHFLGDERGIL
jgi:hypothetical protein